MSRQLKYLNSAKSQVNNSLHYGCLNFFGNVDSIEKGKFNQSLIHLRNKQEQFKQENPLFKDILVFNQEFSP